MCADEPVLLKLLVLIERCQKTTRITVWCVLWLHSSRPVRTETAAALQQINMSCYKATVVQEQYSERRKVWMLNWPPSSQVLNSNETLWDVLDKQT